LITTLSVILSWCQGGEAAFLSWCQGGEAAFLSGSRYELLFTEVSKRCAKFCCWLHFIELVILYFCALYFICIFLRLHL
jgi:hypothetical protein